MGTPSEVDQCVPGRPLVAPNLQHPNRFGVSSELFLISSICHGVRT